MKIFLSFFLLAALKLLLPYNRLIAQDIIQFYVAPNGKATANGSNIATPFASLENAQQAIRKLKQTGKLTKPIMVNLWGGTYKISKPFVFDEEDGGTEDSPII